ncbi:MAG: hypothetical protein KIT43_08460 [Bauldia sp.]|nr:hypothetical protein [Bauldia sp.]MCW5716843.1 hypothetical protein [Bauldia sp.]
MQRPTIIVGTAAAVLALGLGLFGTGFGAAMASPGFQAAVILTPILLAAGTGLVLVVPGFAAFVLLFGTFGLLYSFGFNFVTALPVLLSSGAGVMAAGIALRPAELPVEAEEAPPRRVQLSGGNRDDYPP